MSDDLWFNPAFCLIGGAWRPPVTGQYLTLVDPSDGADLAQIARGGAEDVDAAVTAAQSALDGDWGRTTALERGRILTRIGQLVLTRTEALAQAEPCGSRMG